jgi:3-oxoacyl-[acyl-carrier protein] reductase
VLSGRHADSLAAAVAELGGAAVSVTADNADPETPARLVAAARDSFGRLDGVLVSVGGPPTGSVTTTSDEDWTHAFESVFLGAVRVARAFVAELGEGGSVTFVLSSSVRSPIPNLAISNGLRPGLAMVAKTLADEVGPRGIRVNGLLPGRIGTERVAELDAATGDADAAREKSLKTIPLGRYGDPDEFGRVAAFLMSPASAFISGVMLPVDGGMLRAL